MTLEQKEQRPIVIDSFRADPRSQNGFGMPVSELFTRQSEKDQKINPFPAVVGGLIVAGLIALGLKNVHKLEPSPETNAPDTSDALLASDARPKIYTGEISVKISPELNIRTDPWIAERYGMRKSNAISWDNIQAINEIDKKGLLEFKVKDGLIVPGEDIEGSKNWIVVNVQTSEGNVQGYISMSTPTMNAGLVQRDNFGRFLAATAQGDKTLNNSRTEAIRAGGTSSTTTR